MRCCLRGRRRRGSRRRRKMNRKIREEIVSEVMCVLSIEAFVVIV